MKVLNFSLAGNILEYNIELFPQKINKTCFTQIPPHALKHCIHLHGNFLFYLDQNYRSQPLATHSNRK